MIKMDKIEARYRIDATVGTKGISEDTKLTFTINELINIMTSDNLVKKLTIHSVSQHRELLIAYDMKANKILGSDDDTQRKWSEQAVDEYISNL